ncbi:AIPR family protein [Aeromonas hydrophila]|uniref:AIPR family protein n=1 Tax=Aeromonas hydrophila TaxID=644 RepID=UPI003672FB1A
MSKLHVTQIGGYLKQNLNDAINMKDYENKPQEKRDIAFLTRALGVLTISQLTDQPMKDICHCVTDGYNDGGIDLIFFEPKEKVLYLVQTKWHQDGSGSISLGDTLKFIEGVKKVLDNDLDNLNDKVKARKLDIELALFDANAKFVLVLAHTGQDNISEDIRIALTSYIDSQNDTSDLMSLKVIKQDELHRSVAAGVAGSPISQEIQLTSWGQIREPHAAFYGQVCSSDVALWMEEHGTRLFEKNLRNFIGRSLVNQDIVNTLIERPENFWYFNNGITALVTSISKKPLGGNSTEFGIFECEGFCVVNGAQTVGSIHYANQISPEITSKAMVPIRIISGDANSGEFSLEVTRYTNTQNAIEKRDFVALDPNQERIRQELQIDGVAYAYKTGAATGPTGSSFGLHEATIALACIYKDVTLAVQAKREIGKLWDDINKPPYKNLFNKGVTGPAIWQTVQILRFIDNEVQKEVIKYSGREALICTHGNRFIQWASMNTLRVDLKTSLAEVEEKIAPVVSEIIKEVISQVKENYQDSYPASIFKNLAKCKVIAENITSKRMNK